MLPIKGDSLRDGGTKAISTETGAIEGTGILDGGTEIIEGFGEILDGGTLLWRP